MKQLPTSMQRLALKTVAGVGLCAWLAGAGVPAVHADGAPGDQAQEAGTATSPKHAARSKKAKHSKAAVDPQPSAAEAKTSAAIPQPAAAAPPEPAFCKLNEPEQPRGGRVDVLGDRFGSAPVVRIAGKPARILLRKQDRISVQIPADSDGGEITVLNQGKVESCGTLVIIGKNRE
jgi:hypothetical protein